MGPGRVQAHGSRVAEFHHTIRTHTHPLGTAMLGQLAHPDPQANPGQVPCTVSPSLGAESPSLRREQLPSPHSLAALLQHYFRGAFLRWSLKQIFMYHGRLGLFGSFLCVAQFLD